MFWIARHKERFKHVYVDKHPKKKKRRGKLWKEAVQLTAKRLSTKKKISMNIFKSVLDVPGGIGRHKIHVIWGIQPVDHLHSHSPDPHHFATPIHVVIH